MLCTGKVYYDLLQEREARGIKDVAIVRLEQLYPFPRTSLTRELSRYKNADVVWCQEESHNMGAWTFVDRRLEDCIVAAQIKASRPSTSAATKRHPGDRHARSGTTANRPSSSTTR